MTKPLTIFTALAMLSANALAECGPQSVPPGSLQSVRPDPFQWQRFARMKFRIAEPQSSDYTEFNFSRSNDGSEEISAEINSVYAARSSHSNIALLDPYGVLLTKGVSSPQGKEREALEIPLLANKLAVTALAEAQPGGHNAVKQNQTVSVSNECDGIRIANHVLARDFPPPWTLRGTLSRPDSNTVDYKLTFTYSPTATATRTLLITGSWQTGISVPGMGSTMALEEWKAYRLPPPAGNDGKLALTATQGFKTLGQLQDAVKADLMKGAPPNKGR